jgi:hypothetical protein
MQGQDNAFVYCAASELFLQKALLHMLIVAQSSSNMFDHAEVQAIKEVIDNDILKRTITTFWTLKRTLQEHVQCMVRVTLPVYPSVHVRH